VAGPADAEALLDLKRRLDLQSSFMMFEPDERDSSPGELARELGDAARSGNSVVIVAEASGASGR
jgi:hypothetical protein